MPRRLAPLCSRPEGVILVGRSRYPAVGVKARVFTRRKGERVPAVVYADADGTTRLRQPLTGTRYGLPGFVVPKQHLETVATFRGRAVASAEQAQATTDTLEHARTTHAAAVAASEAREQARAETQRAIVLERAQARLAYDPEPEMAFPDPIRITVTSYTDGAFAVFDVAPHTPTFDPRLQVTVLGIAPSIGTDDDLNSYYNINGPSTGEGVPLVIDRDLNLFLIKAL